MIEPLVIRKVIKGTGGPPLWVMTTEHYPVDPGQQYGPHAHYAGFQGDIEGRAVEAPAHFFAGCPADGDDLGMGDRVAAAFPEIKAASEYRIVSDHNSANGDFTPVSGFFGLTERNPHPVIIVPYYQILNPVTTRQVAGQLSSATSASIGHIV